MVKLSYIIPRSELTHEQIEDIKNQAMNQLVQAIQANGNDPAQYIVRDILPTTDLGIGSNDSWTFDLAAGDNTVVNKTLDNDKHIVFYGIEYPDPTKVVTKITFKRGQAETLAVYQIEKIYGERDPVGYFRTPIAYPGGQPMTIVLTAKAADSSEMLVFRGFLAEKAGLLITG